MNDLFLLRLCTDGAAYEVRPKKQIKLDLPAFSQELAAMTNMRIRVSLPAILVLEDDDRSVTVYPSGKLLLRKFESEESAKQIALLLSPKLYSSNT